MLKYIISRVNLTIFLNYHFDQPKKASFKRMAFKLL